MLHNFSADIGTPLSGVIQAGDGNLYGATSGYLGVYDIGSDFGSVYRIGPQGAYQQIYAFTGGTDGSSPVASAPFQGSDGSLYGSTYGSFNSEVSGNFYKMPLSGGTPSNLFVYANSAPDANGDQTSTVGVSQGVSLIQGSDGNFYGGTGGGTIPGSNDINNGFGSIYSISPAGIGTPLAILGFTYGWQPGTPLEASDGNFYGTLTNNGQYGGGAIYMVKPGQEAQASTIYSFYNFTGGADGGQPGVQLVEGSDGNLYGSTQQGGSHGFGTFFQLTFAGKLTVLYNWPDATGILGGPFFQGGDGNFYYTGFGLGNYGQGFVGRFNPNTFAIDDLYDYGAGGANDPNNANALLVGSDGILYGTSVTGGTANNGTIFSLTLTPALPAPVQITSSATANAIAIGSPVTLKWQVLNAFSNTMQQCYAYTLPVTADSALWTGKQTGTLDPSSHIYAGSITFTPTVQANYTYTLNCGGIETGLTTLKVGTGNAVTIQNATLPDATYKVAYSTTLSATGGTAPYTWARISGKLPAGLVLSSAGVISGTATQVGPYSFTISATDATGVSASASLSITVIGPFAITTTSLPNGEVGNPYNAVQLTAAGGVPPYTNWQVVNTTFNTVSPGLILSSAGVVSGTPTAAGQYALTFDANDATGAQASATVTLTIGQQLLVNGSVSLSPTAIPVGGTTQVTLAVLPSSGGPAPTGTVQFLSNGLNFGDPVAVGSSVTVTSPIYTATGSYPINAAYSGDLNYSPVTIAPATLTVNVAATTPVISVNPSAVTVTSAGGSGTATVSESGFSGTPTFGCTGLPAGAACQFAALSSAGTSALQITTTAVTAFNAPPNLGRMPAGPTLAFVFPGLLAFGAAIRFRKDGKQQIRLLSLLILFVIAGALAGCGSGGTPSSGGNNSSGGGAGTPSGVSTVSITATSGTQTAITTLTLTVQ